MGYVGGARNRKSPCRSMEASKHTPNGANETPGVTTKTPRLPCRIEMRSIFPVLPPEQVEGNQRIL
jgi:hypothetical protein